MKVKVGDYALFGDRDDNITEKHIYLGTFNGRHLAVMNGDEQNYLNGRHFDACSWRFIKPIEEQEKFEYPMWFKSKIRDMIVEFTGISTGEIICIDSDACDFYKKGHKSVNWVFHTDTSFWEQVENQITYADYLIYDTEDDCWISGISFRTLDACKMYYDDGIYKYHQEVPNTRRVIKKKKVIV